MSGQIVAVRLEGTFPRADLEAASSPSLVVVDEGANLVARWRLDVSRYR